jgi:hypothetical protein
VDDLLEAARARIERVTPPEAQRAMERGAALVDLRCPGERKRTGIRNVCLPPEPAL